MPARPLVVAAMALLLAGWALYVLEGARAGLSIDTYRLGDTPVTRISDGSDGPPVVVAHGFAGSRQMMQAYGHSMAQAGYTVYAFDFLGHGRHPRPMGGDVTQIEGTTRLLMDQTGEVIAHARARHPGVPVALLGHSMATDVLVRTAADRTVEGPVILLSPFSGAVTDTEPGDLLMIAGQWEARLLEFSLDQLRKIDPEAELGDTVRQADLRRRAVAAPLTEHVAILHSRAGRGEAVDWLNGHYGRSTPAPVPPTGWALLALLAGITILFRPLSGRLPARQTAGPRNFASGWLAAAMIVPALAAPLLAAPVEIGFLPVLVADYLAVHLALYGVVQLAILWWAGWRPGPVSAAGTALLLVWGLGVFGLGLDRYGANFVPDTTRLAIIAVLAIGAVPFMLADSVLTRDAPLWQRILARAAFLVSLGVAVALDFEGLFFLLLIAPVILLYFLTFGMMGHWVARRSGALSAGLALGLILAWALGVSFPLFETGGLA